MSGTPLLSLAIWVPILAGFVVLATGSDRNAPLARMLSLIGALAGLLVTLPLYTGFDLQTAAMQFVEFKSWIPRFNVNYHLGVDGISMPFVILNSFITVTVVLAGWQVIGNKVAFVCGLASRCRSSLSVKNRCSSGARSLIAGPVRLDAFGEGR